jgi:predicted secreted hydrolase
MGWKVTIPNQEIELKIAPEFTDQELITVRSTRVTYWEGAVQVSGTIRNRPMRGMGYVELTGYAGKLKI